MVHGGIFPFPPEKLQKAAKVKLQQLFLFLQLTINNNTLISGTFMEKAAFNKTTLFDRNLEINLRKKPAKYYIWSTALCGAETWTLRKVDQEHLEMFEMRS